MGTVFHEYEYGPVPLLPSPVAAPLFPPLHKTLVDALTDATSKVGSVIITLEVFEQPFASVTVTM
jgi:hypothetical protein